MLSVGEILAEALRLGGECSREELAVDLYVAAVAHDLYEDTAVTPAEVRERFGERVDRLVEGMTNRGRDLDRSAYLERLGDAADEVRLIKLADLIDNVASCAYGLRDLGPAWVRATFLPIAEDMWDVVTSTTYPRFPRTAEVMLLWLDFAMSRLRANLDIARATDRDPGAVADEAAASWGSWDGNLDGASDGDAVRRQMEREWREGALVRGARVFPRVWARVQAVRPGRG